MVTKRTLERLAAAEIKDQYAKQLSRVKANRQQTDKIENAVSEVIANLPKAPTGSLVIYGDPQSGKTEMMICLTAQLLDDGHKIIVHLLNDSVDLLRQSLDRFSRAGLAPAPRNSGDLANSPLVRGQSEILFCKKNASDLRKLVNNLGNCGSVVVIDDEADYATPNAQINRQQTTRINRLVSELLGTNEKYVGVTATPARLNLNNTFDNRTETWVRFHPHDAYTGQDQFFPQSGPSQYRLKLLPGPGTTAEAVDALARFLVTVAYLNTRATGGEKNYSFLVHTSGRTADHKTYRNAIEAAMTALVSRKGAPLHGVSQSHLRASRATIRRH